MEFDLIVFFCNIMMVCYYSEFGPPIEINGLERKHHGRWNTRPLGDRFDSLGRSYFDPRCCKYFVAVEWREEKCLFPLADKDIEEDRQEKQGDGGQGQKI